MSCERTGALETRYVCTNTEVTPRGRLVHFIFQEKRPEYVAHAPGRFLFGHWSGTLRGSKKDVGSVAAPEASTYPHSEHVAEWEEQHLFVVTINSTS